MRNYFVKMSIISMISKKDMLKAIAVRQVSLYCFFQCLGNQSTNRQIPINSKCRSGF